jgi:hypothetical protein
LAKRDDLFLLFLVQDIAHVDGGYSSRPGNVLTSFSLAGFQVTTVGRFWVTAEDQFELSAQLHDKRAEVTRPSITHLGEIYVRLTEHLQTEVNLVAAASGLWPKEFRKNPSKLGEREYALLTVDNFVDR